MARRRLLKSRDDELERPTNGDTDAWSEEGSDLLMDFDVLTRIRREAIEVELQRARRVERRGE